MLASYIRRERKLRFPGNSEGLGCTGLIQSQRHPALSPGLWDNHHATESVGTWLDSQNKHPNTDPAHGEAAVSDSFLRLWIIPKVLLPWLMDYHSLPFAASWPKYPAACWNTWRSTSTSLIVHLLSEPPRKNWVVSQTYWDALIAHMWHCDKVREQVFWNRKGQYSVNIQAVCDSKLLFTHCCARFSGVNPWLLHLAE